MGDSLPTSTSSRSILSFALAAVLPILWLVASLFPDSRLWGLNLWAFFPVNTAIAIAVVTPIVLTAAWRLAPLAVRPEPPSSLFRIFFFALPPGAGLLFWFLRNRTHFLGDGYQVLAQLAEKTPLIKTSETGETLLHLAVRNLLGDGQTAVLHSYQFLSIAAGVLFVITVVLFAARLFSRTVDRVLFTLGLLSGGYALLFFGYVENYSLYVLAVLWFLLTGIMIAKGRASRFWILLPLGAAIFLHVIGIALTPAALYLLLADTGLARLRRSIKGLIGAVVLVTGLIVFLRLYTTNLFFRYAFVPVVPIEITADGYTLFAGRHLLDYLNLWLMLIPGLPLLLLSLRSTGRADRAPRRDLRFLTIAAVTAATIVFVLDPKLGMPRDWDLFSFAALPVLMLLLLLALSSQSESIAGRRLVLYAVVLGSVALGSRVAVQRNPDIAIDRLHTYMALDHARNRATYQVLRDYYLADRNQVAADSIESSYRHDYPEAALGVRAESLVRAGNAERAIETANRAIDLNPMYWAGYAGLGYALIQKQQYDSALTVLRIANGLNPNNPVVLHNLGYAWLWAGDTRKAELFWKRAYRLDTTQTQTLIYLARLYAQEKRPEDYVTTLRQIAGHPDAPLKSILELADTYARAGLYSEAAALYQRARTAGLDENLIRKRLKTYPQLKNYMSVVE